MNRSKLEIAYQYETELLQRLEKARQNTKALQSNLFSICNQITQRFDKMKNILDVFTGNFFNNLS